MLAPTEVLVSVEAVCLSPEDFPLNADVAPGGAVVGRVTECGDEASALMDARVLVSAINACGECPLCRHGLVAACSKATILGRDVDGGWAQNVVTQGRWLTQLDERLDVQGPQAALIAGPVLTAYTLYTRANIGPGDILISLGHSPVAQVVASLGNHRGAQVIAVHGEQADEHIRQALKQSDSVDCPQKILLCDAGSDWEQALGFAVPGSVIVGYAQEGNISSHELCAREITVLGFRYSHPDLLPELAALVVKGELTLDSLQQPGKISDAGLRAASTAFEVGKCLVATP